MEIKMGHSVSFHCAYSSYDVLRGYVNK